MTEAQFRSLCPEDVLCNCRNAVQSGFAAYANHYDHVADIHDHIVAEAKRIVCGPNVVFRVIGQRNLFFLNDSLIIVFKKLNENLQSHNYPTKAALSFNLQEDLKGIPSSLPRVEVGYLPDSGGAAILGIFVVCRNGNQIDWSIDLNDDTEPRQPDLKLA